MMTSFQVVETSVNVITSSPSQDYTHPDNHNLPTYDMTSGFKAFTIKRLISTKIGLQTRDKKKTVLKPHARKQTNRINRKLENLSIYDGNAGSNKFPSFQN